MVVMITGDLQLEAQFFSTSDNPQVIWIGDDRSSEVLGQLYAKLAYFLAMGMMVGACVVLEVNCFLVESGAGEG
ncbi:hypothetical protein IEQ34_003366 [Dendrobium chrysotoxum]|uniref:Uncharacterized protein n=1 Tax=Dendrobium chrysotoxum TaxID=161865 RepID=A0AAV7HLG7_DENCH|nr:hypothetical protein IEQ34_003366 [Dendrobium chrysotoxum]